jgi:PilZ domain
MSMNGHDRRANRRYEINLPIRFRGTTSATGRWTYGMSRDMSSIGLCIVSPKRLPAGAHVELIIDWPYQSRGAGRIDLEATGFVVRSEDDRLAVRLTSHQFRVGADRRERQIADVAS